MAVNDIVSIITSVGFPIFACLALGWYVKYQTDSNKADMKELRESHESEIQKVTEALNNNTLALQKLCDKLDMERKD